MRQIYKYADNNSTLINQSIYLYIFQSYVRLQFLPNIVGCELRWLRSRMSFADPDRDHDQAALIIMTMNLAVIFFHV